MYITNLSAKYSIPFNEWQIPVEILIKWNRTLLFLLYPRLQTVESQWLELFVEFVDKEFLA